MGSYLSSISRLCMTNIDSPVPSARAEAGVSQSLGRSESGEDDRMAHTLSLRFSPHVQAAAAAVRAAERDLALASEQLERAREAEERARYRSDPLVFMRAAVKDEVEGLGRKTTTKKVRAAYRYLLDRAVELAEGEVRGFEVDQAAVQRARHDSVDACLEAEGDARGRLEAARELQRRVHEAEQWATQGLALMMAKLAAEAEPE